MKKIFKLPTIVGLIILVTGLATGLFLINSRAIFKLGAQTEASPKNVRVSNITTSSITVSWVTDTKTGGFIKWGESQTTITKVSQDIIGQNSFTHATTITGLDPGTEVFFKINSGSKDWDNNGVAWQSKTSTLAINNPDAQTISGTIANQSGAPVSGSLVYISVNGKLLSTTTSSEGNWLINPSVYATFDKNNTILEISVDAGEDGVSTALIYPNQAQHTPLIALGKTYDFRTINTNEGGDLPESDLSIPEQVESSSRFEVTGEKSENSGTSSVTLDSHEEGEIITTTDPEFFGKAPAGTQIEISVESEVQNATISSNQQNSWSWSPPQNLEPGEHTITIKWKDSDGILRVLTRSFIVSAAEGPAFESTPSATPSQTQTPVAATSTPTSVTTSTPTSVSTPTVISSPTSTASATAIPLPETGSLTPTVGLFIMGMGILLSSFFVYRTADE